MSIIDARVVAGGALVAPHGVTVSGHNVGECTVKELEQLIPLSGVVETCLMTPEPNGIVDDVLRVG